MIELMKFEWRKIIKRKSTLISVALIMLFTAWLFVLPAFQEQTTDLQGDVHKGLAAIKVNKEIAEQQPTELTEAVLGKTIQTYQKIAADPKSYIEDDDGEKYFTPEVENNFYRKNRSLLQLSASTFSDPEYYVNADYASKIPVKSDGTVGFYNQFHQNQQLLLSRDIPENGGKMTFAEKSYWQKQSKEIKTPYHYGYHAGWSNISDRIAFIPFLILMICISLAPVFASEYQERTDVLILSSKYGRSKVIGSKVIMSYLFGVVIYGLTMLLALGGSLALFGTEGADLPIQLGTPNSPFPWTYSRMVSIHIILGLLIMLGMIGVTLSLSSKMTTPIPVLITDVILLMLPFIVPKSTGSVLYNLLVNLLPGVQLNMKFVAPITYSLGGWTTNLFIMSGIVYLVLILVTVPWAIRSFRRHQVA